MKKVLKVPYVRQPFGYSCLPASVKMVLNYYGDDADMEKLFEAGRIGAAGCFDVLIGPLLIKKGYKCTSFYDDRITDYWSLDTKELKLYARMYKKALKAGVKRKKGATMTDIKKFINSGVPAIAEVLMSTFYGRKVPGTHALVVIGYDKNNFYLHDPEGKLGQEAAKISIKDFMKSWNWEPKCNGSMFVIEKKK